MFPSHDLNIDHKTHFRWNWNFFAAYRQYLEEFFPEIDPQLKIYFINVTQMKNFKKHEILDEQFVDFISFIKDNFENIIEKIRKKEKPTLESSTMTKQ